MCRVASATIDDESSPAAQEEAERHVAHQTALHRGAQQLDQPFAPFALGIRRHRIERLDHEVPVLLDRDALRRDLERQRMPAGQLVDPVVERVRCGDVAVREVLLETALRERRARAGRMAPDRGELGREQEGAVAQRPEERLLAEAVAAAEEQARGPVVERERPHPVQAVGEGPAPGAIAVQQHLGVGVIAVEAAAERREFGAQLDVVVDLAVEDHADLSVVGPHRLMTAADVDDREPAVTEMDAACLVHPGPLVVGTAVRERGVHPPQVLDAAASDEARHRHTWTDAS